jgi:hypothetical protein
MNICCVTTSRENKSLKMKQEILQLPLFQTTEIHVQIYVNFSTINVLFELSTLLEIFEHCFMSYFLLEIFEHCFMSYFLCVF